MRDWSRVPPAALDSLLLTPMEAGELLRVHWGTVYRWMSEGRLEGFLAPCKGGKTRRMVTLGELRRWQSSLVRPPPPKFGKN